MRLYFVTFLYVLSLIAADGSRLYAKGIASPAPEVSSVDFIENRGQWDHPGRFVAPLHNGALFLTDSGFMYHFIDPGDMERYHDLLCDGGNNGAEPLPDTLPLHHHAYRVRFLGANTRPEYEVADKRRQYHNYFLGKDSSRWKGGVGLFGKVIQKDIYKGIDLVLHSEAQELKYDFVVSAGTDPGSIRMQFEGVEPVLNAQGELVIETSVNKIIEKAPYTYQVVNGERKVVSSRYRLEDGVVSFEFPESYDSRYALIIDPTLHFATYSTAKAGSYFAFSTTYDKEGNLYAGAQALSDGLAWPATTGAFQTKHAGISDIGINKYNASGTAIIYSTYFGGNDLEAANAMIVNDNNELIVVGSTSSINLPVTEGCYQSYLKSGTDIFVAHFNSSGTTLIGSSYIGGRLLENTVLEFDGRVQSGIPGYKDISSPIQVNYDREGNIWVFSNTFSRDFPVTANAFQKELAGNSDAVLFQLDATCSRLLYSTYLGGSGTDAGFGLEWNRDGNLVICGTTLSKDFPVTSGVLHSVAQGMSDGFVCIVDPSTGSLKASTYLGTDNIDWAVGVQVDPDNNVYVLGRTLGNYPISPGIYHMDSTDLFIDKLSADLDRSLLSTRLGRKQSSSTTARYLPYSFLLDNCENVYVTGIIYNIAGMPVTDDAFMSDPNVFWYIVLKPQFSDILFGTYFGAPDDVGAHVHAGVQRMDPDGIVYQSFCSNSAGFFTTPGVVGQDKLNTGQDMLSFKFSFSFSGVRSVISLAEGQNDTGCAPYTVQFQNDSRSPFAMDFTWDFGDGSPVTRATHPTHTFYKPGTYKVVLHAHSDSACKTNDYDTLVITVFDIQEPQVVTSDTIVCASTDEVPLTVYITNRSYNNRIRWEPAAGILSGGDKDTVLVNPHVSQVYYVRVSDTIPGICGISVTDTVHVDFAPRVLRIHTPDTAVCEGARIQVRATGTEGYTYKWIPGSDTDDSTLLEPVITARTSNYYHVIASYPGCKDTVASLYIDVQPVPQVTVSEDVYVCPGDQVALTSLVTPYRNDYRYYWSNAADSHTYRQANLSFTASVSGVYYLEVLTPAGCAARDSALVTVYPAVAAEAIADTGVCPGDSIRLWASGGVHYKWLPGYGLNDTTVRDPVAHPQTSTMYVVTIVNEYGCSDSHHVWLEVYPNAVLNMPDSISLYPGESYHVEPATNCYYFEWFPPSGISDIYSATPVFQPEVRTRYFVTAFTEHNCVVKDSIDILVEASILDMPNAFSPSGLNNTFRPARNGIARLNRFTIYNRWGNVVFSTSDINEGWDGTYNGMIQPLGVYIYVIDAVLDNGRIVRSEGNVTLLR